MTPAPRLPNKAPAPAPARRPKAGFAVKIPTPSPTRKLPPIHKPVISLDFVAVKLCAKQTSLG